MVGPSPIGGSELESQLAKANISISYAFSPIQFILCDLSGLIGNFCQELLGAFYPRIVSKRANILISELVTNVLQNTVEPTSQMMLDLDVNQDRLIIRVKNAVTPDQFDKVRVQVDRINQAEDLKRLMRDTIRERRRLKEKGGLGLIRLVAENKSQLSVSYEGGYLVVTSQLDVGGTP
ncbi:DUF6272 family protein [Myxococcota bacterium]|jgi:hypothetical protein|nr:DUF6272 family protein [Myxococcota bacterium]